jgi:ZIP family zinc transporter
MHAVPYLLSFYLFLGTNSGALVACVIYKTPKIKAPHLYLLCGVVLTALLVLELIPHALKEYGFISVTFGASLGVLICMGLHHLMAGTLSPTYRPALFLVAAIAVHNIPAGLAIGSTLDNQILSTSFITAMMIHQIPEGLAVMASLLLSDRRRLSLLVFFLFSVLLSGVFLFFSILGHSLALPIKLNGLILGIAIGLLLFTALWEFLFKKHS